MKADGRNHHEHERIVELADFPTQFEAEIVVAKLKANGIAVSVEDGRPYGAVMGATLAFGATHRVFVFEGDLERAQSLIAEE